MLTDLYRPKEHVAWHWALPHIFPLSPGIFQVQDSEAVGKGPPLAPKAWYVKSEPEEAVRVQVVTNWPTQQHFIIIIKIIYTFET